MKSTSRELITRTISKALNQRLASNFGFVPKCKPVTSEDVETLKKFIEDHRQICVLTGAGISTESGIPDYRSTGVGLYARSNKRPVLYKEFCGSEQTRKRYWARNFVGWPKFSTVEPNFSHKVLKELEDIGKVSCVVTQNVDRLHTKAGTKNVVELHGTAFVVMCLNCDFKMSRLKLQDVFNQLNPNVRLTSDMIRPDGDVELSQEQVEGFKVPPCEKCGGVVKPDIVFFGDNVPRERVELIKREVESADSLLVVGTSLSTFSGYRIIMQAADAKKPIAIVNIGDTRGDEHADIKIDGRCGEIFQKIDLNQLS